MKIQGQDVPQRLVGVLNGLEEDDHDAWRDHLEDHGWLLLRGALSTRAVHAARAEVLNHLIEADEIEWPASVGLATGRSRRREIAPDLGRFWQTVSTGPQLRRLCASDRLGRIVVRLLDHPAHAAPFLWVRVKAAGMGGPLRQGIRWLDSSDVPALVAWVPLGSIEFHQGTPYVIARSHRRAVAAGERAFPLSMERLADAPDGCLLTSRFDAGDVLILGPRTLYGAFDNEHDGLRVRVSCESLWQPQGRAFHSGLEGPDPRGLDGLGYGGLPSSLPLTEQAGSDA